MTRARTSCSGEPRRSLMDSTQGCPAPSMLSRHTSFQAAESCTFQHTHFKPELNVCHDCDQRRACTGHASALGKAGACCMSHE